MTTAISKRTAELNESNVTPLVDVLENEHEFLLYFDLPGVTGNNINLNLNDRQLSLIAERQLDDGDNNAKVVYNRSFELPQGIDLDATKSSLKDGVLSLRLQKSEAIKPRRIEVETA